MTIREIPIDDIGNIFRAAIVAVDVTGAAVDVSAATAKQIIFMAPDGTETTKTATFTNTGTDGKIEYKRLSGEFQQLGTWSYKGKVTFGAGDVYEASLPTEFKVIE